MSARSRTSDGEPVAVPGKERPREHVEERGPEQQADEDFTEHGRLADPGRRRAGRLGGGNHQRQEQQDLQGVGHLSFTLLASGFPVRVQVQVRRVHRSG